MILPTAYKPKQGFKFQIMSREPGEDWKHCDYAKTTPQKNFLSGEAEADAAEVKSIILPVVYWPKTA